MCNETQWKLQWSVQTTNQQKTRDLELSIYILNDLGFKNVNFLFVFENSFT